MNIMNINWTLLVTKHKQEIQINLLVFIMSPLKSYNDELELELFDHNWMKIEDSPYIMTLFNISCMPIFVDLQYMPLV